MSDSQPSSPSPAPANAFFPPPYRVARPLKRQRCSSTSRQARASSSATPDDLNVASATRMSSTSRQARTASSATPDDFNVEREASAMRMFDVWSQLAEKYSTRIDEDDIVDLVTGEIVKDRGVLSRETTWKFPRFADVDDVESTGTDEDDEDDVDELDALTGTGAVSVRGWMVPPVREVDPADAKDLQEFMEAERRRREECGEEELSEDGGDLAENQDDADDAEVDDTGQDSDVVVPSPAASRRAERRDSDDELDSHWDIVDESNSVSPVKSDMIEMSDSPPARPFNPSFTTPKTRKPPVKTLHSKSDGKRHPQDQLQLQTPPQSRTPSSSVDETTPIASPPSQPPSSESFSPTQRNTKAQSIPTRGRSQVRTRSQSRGRSPSLKETLPRLDLAELQRGRSASRRSVRPAASKSDKNVHARQGSASLKWLDLSSKTPSGSKSASPCSRPASVSPTPNGRRSSQRLRVPSEAQPQPMAIGKGRKEREATDKSQASDRKGKGRAVDVEEACVDDEPWREDSNDPLALPSTTPVMRHIKGRGSHSSSGEKPSQQLPLFKEERVPLPRSPEPLPKSSKKRKRKSLSCDSDDSHSAHMNADRARESLSAKHNRRSSSASAKFQPKRSPEQSEEAFHSEWEHEVEPHPSSSNCQPRHAPTPMPPYYPSPSYYPFPPYPPPTDVHPTVPLHDPRAQFIIAQAMHQLSTLFTAPWPAQPFTPPRHPSSARPSSASGSSSYSYPTTPHHPHTSPYVFDSGASVGSLPPSSPPSSSPPPSSPLRRASLVPRSRSRGRRVSFKLDGDLMNAEADAQRTVISVTHVHKESVNSRSPSVKGKKQMVVASPSDSETETASRINVDEEAGARFVARAQTPGPPIAQTPVVRRRTRAKDSHR
ncbi:hypothetical protein DFH06DRAFT_1170558 [Mycena polygramma]|nr:hypothetical protein DFH06DRAFT_1170558 [Mycena polygramma]